MLMNKINYETYLKTVETKIYSFSLFNSGEIENLTDFF